MTRKWRTSWYLDMEATRPVDFIDFGVVEEGDTKDKVLFLKNLERHPISYVDYYSNNLDLIITGPKEYEPYEVKPVHFKWVTSEDCMILDHDVYLRGSIIRSSNTYDVLTRINLDDIRQQ